MIANCEYIEYWIWNTKRDIDKGRYFSDDPFVQIVVGLIFIFVKFLHGVGMVATKRLIATDGYHVTYFVGIVLFIVNAVIVSFNTQNKNYH